MRHDPEPSPAPSATAEPLFFPVGICKLALMFAATFGLYSLHWCYENWWAIKKRTNGRFNPATRTFFAPLFIHALFRHIQRAAQAGDLRTAFVPSAATGVYLTGFALAQIVADDLAVIALLPLYVPFHYAQCLANRVNAERSPGAERNERLTVGNKITIGLGGALLVLALCLALAGLIGRLSG